MNSICRLLTTLAIICLASLAQAETGNDRIDRYFEALASAKSETAGREAESHIWEYWLDQAPNREIRALIDKAMERRRAYDLEAAENLLDKVVTMAPDYAEGYNQRAFVRFMREKFDPALSDLEKTLALEPRHFGALSGIYHVLRLQNRHQAAFRSLKLAVEIHPWIQERHALPEAMWPQNYRDIHKPGTNL